MEKYYTPEQAEEIRKRGEVMGEEQIRQVEAEWSELMEKVRVEMEKGTEPTSDAVQRLAAQWMDLVNQFTGGNPEIVKAVGNMWNQEQTIHGIDTGEMRKMMEYISKALAANHGA
jgi:hypothetical protein